MRIAHVNGVDIAYNEHGAGIPVLCIHGGLIVDTFAPFEACPELAGVRLVRYHRRDLGRSAMSPVASPTVSDHAADAIALMDHLGIVSAHIVGHSLGATIGLQVTLDAPARVLSLTMLEGGLTADLPAADKLLAAAVPMIEAYTSGDREGAARVFLSMVLGEDYERSLRDNVPGGLTQAMRDANALVERELPAAATHHFDLDAIARITTPVQLVLGGESDRAASPELGGRFFTENHEILRGVLPNVDEVLLPGLTHLLQIQDPRAVAAVVSSFIAAQKRRRAVLTIVLAASMAVIAPMADADTTSSCTDGVLPVSFGPGRPNTLSIVNRLCRAVTATSTVHVLVSGSALPLVYWDPAYQPERYSMVRVLNASGLDTYTYDRVGTAASSKPPSFMVDTAVDVWNLHQIVQHLRRSYERVITGGVSSGAVVAAREAAQFHDVDGVVLMGMLHQLDAVRLGLAAPAMKPAILDPRWTTSGLDPGYVTFGDIGFAIEPDDTDPGMAAYLEGLVDVITGTQQATLLPYMLVTARDETRAIDVPVLVAVGQRDTLMCGPLGTDCSDAASVMRAEAPFYADAARLETFVLPGSGHSMNSERNAPDWFVAEAEWAQRVVLGIR